MKKTGKESLLWVLVVLVSWLICLVKSECIVKPQKQEQLAV